MQNTLYKKISDVFKKLEAKSKKQKAFSSGFTFMELIFVISIFGIMAGIVLFGFRTFGDKAALDNLAQDIALEIVGAQKAAISGVSTTALPGFVPGTVPSYGVYFSDNSTDTVNPLNKQFTYFADNPPQNKLYDTSVLPCGTSGLECISTTAITTGEYISNICYDTASSSVPNCVDSGSAHITFIRPFPDATMKVCDTSTGSCTGLGLGAIRTYIEISSGADTTQKRTIVVNSLGEVRVANGGAHDVYCAAGGLSGC